MLNFTLVMPNNEIKLKEKKTNDKQWLGLFIKMSSDFKKKM